jgi:hypothetical protein
MSIIIYHKNLKVLTTNKITEKQNIDYFKYLGNRLIIQGLKMNRKLPEQINIYKSYINQIQNIKKYKLKIEDIDYYACCVLALWKLGVYDPEDATSPIYISPTRKTSRRRTLLR